MNKLSLIMALTICLSGCTSINDRISEYNTNYEYNIRFDGIYLCEENFYTSYLRFYEDGTFIQMSSRSSIAEIKNFLNKEQDGISYGEYTIIDNKIFFQSISSEGSVDYNGYIYPNSYKGNTPRNRIILNSYSNINGNKAINEYLFNSW